MRKGSFSAALAAGIWLCSCDPQDAGGELHRVARATGEASTTGDANTVVYSDHDRGCDVARPVAAGTDLTWVVTYQDEPFWFEGNVLPMLLSAAEVQDRCASEQGFTSDTDYVHASVANTFNGIGTVVIPGEYFQEGGATLLVWNAPRGTDQPAGMIVYPEAGGPTEIDLDLTTLWDVR